MSDTPRRHDLIGSRRREFVFSTDEQSEPAGGANRNRTDDLMLAKHALSQLSYGPDRGTVLRGQQPERARFLIPDR